MKPKLHTKLANTASQLGITTLSEERKKLVQPFIKYLQHKVECNEIINLHFICTHNSRRSQFSQLWAQTAAYYYGVNVNCFSGGVEVTAFNERAVASIKKLGFQVTEAQSTSRYLQQGIEENPKYTVSFAEEAQPLVMFSKLVKDSSSPSFNFAAIITCSHADKNCPIISGAEARIPLLYEDPKEFDGTAQEEKKYNERSLQIATELFYVFSRIMH